MMRGVVSSRLVDNPELVADIAAAAIAAAAMVRGGLPREQAARWCHDFIRERTSYRQEGPDAQTSRMPWRLIADGVGDCKSQAIFTAALCARSGCRVFLRFATLPGDTEPGHVYAVVDGVPSDPLLEYGQECAYISAIDVPIPNT